MLKKAIINLYYCINKAITLRTMLLIQILWDACDNNFNVTTSMKMLYVIVVRAVICTSLEIASKFFLYLTKSKKN